MPAIEHVYVEANGLKFHVARTGAGRLMLFLHGFPEFWRAWRRPLEHFGARGWLAAAPDLRGYNLSDKPDGVEAYKAKHLIADIDALAAAKCKSQNVSVLYLAGTRLQSRCEKNLFVSRKSDLRPIHCVALEEPSACSG